MQQVAGPFHVTDLAELFGQLHLAYQRAAAVAARGRVEAVDLQLGRLIPSVAKLGGALLVTADHGNADEMLELDPKTGEALRDASGAPRPRTSHSLNPVPFHLYAPSVELRLRTDLAAPGLANVAATVLHLMGWSAPSDYAPSLLAD